MVSKMTNEEAIYVIKNTSINLGRRNGKDIYAEALNMAIKALEQPEIVMCKDCKYYVKDHGWNCIEYTVCSISPLHKVLRKPNDFCSRAERRTDGV